MDWQVGSYSINIRYLIPNTYLACPVLDVELAGRHGQEW